MKPLNVLSKFENHFVNQTVRFQVQLEAGGYFFCSGGFCVCIRSKQGELVPTRNFLNLFFTNPTSKTLVGLRPNPIFSAKITLNEQIFLEKNVFRKLALIHSILHQTGTITSGFEGKKRKHSFRFFLGFLLKYTENRKECILRRIAQSQYAKMPRMTVQKQVVWLRKNAHLTNVIRATWKIATW